MIIPISNCYICRTLITIYLIPILIWIKINCSHLMSLIATNYSKIWRFIRWIWTRPITIRISGRIIKSWIILFNYCSCYFSYCSWLVYSFLHIDTNPYSIILICATSPKIPNKNKNKNNCSNYSCYWPSS